MNKTMSGKRFQLAAKNTRFEWIKNDYLARRGLHR